MKIRNDDFAPSDISISSTHPIAIYRISDPEGITLVGNLQRDYEMLGGNSSIDEPTTDHIDLCSRQRGPTGVYLPPADYFAKLRARKVKKGEVK